MKHTLHMLALAFSIGTGHTASADTFQTGMRNIAIKDGNTERPLEGILWYPAEADAAVSKQHSNAVWIGVEAAKDADAVAGSYPLVVLSHGMYGNARNQNWLADELGQEGYVALSLNHPGTSTWLRDPDHARELWERPKDVSRAIDFALSDSELSALINPERIFMAGHSLGGMTAVQLAGGRQDLAQTDTICAADPSELICSIIELWQLGKTPEDRAEMAKDLSDPRLKGIAVLDLGGTQTFSAESLGAIDTPMFVLGAPKDVQGSLNLDVESRALMAQLPSGIASYLEPATLAHFDMLGTCSDIAIPILEEEAKGDGMICIDGTGERVADHTIVADALLAFFAQQ
ncbi:alpha/beta fold hydrolase [Planktotalea sp.]|uniref:alpha/beta hydrolase family protein n=1 Tax=Planktotalea sp. TaxID=2029877 RepID=UPI003297E627